MIARSDEERFDHEEIIDRWKIILKECSTFISDKAKEFQLPHNIIGQACVASANELSGLCDLFDHMTGEDE